MSRYRWLKVEWPFSIRVLAKRLKTIPFSEASAHGFVIDRVRDDFLEARYIERVEFTDNVVDPFGKEMTFERVEFRQCAFRASTAGPGLELLDAPRTVQNLLSRLTELADFSIAVVPITVDALAWTQAFQKIALLESIVDSLQIGALQLEDGIVAKAVLKGDRDVRASCSALTGKRKFTLEKVQLRIGPPNTGSIVLAQTGSAKLDLDDPSGKLLAALRDSLREISASSTPNRLGRAA